MKITNLELKELSEEFGRLLVECIGEMKVREINDRNAVYECDMCATHEFCDPNVLMDEAFKSIVGHEPDTINNADDINIWASAWTVAKLNNFYLQQTLTTCLS